MPKVLSWIKVFYRHLGDPLKEFSYLVMFALMPVWLSTVIQFLFSREIWKFLQEYLYSGEALLISVATIGPLFYAIMKEYDKNQDGFSRSFPGQNFFVLIILLTCLISAAVLGVKDSGYISEKVSKENLDSALWYLSLIFSTISVLVWFAVTTIRNSLEHAAAQVYRQDTRDFVAEWNK